MQIQVKTDRNIEGSADLTETVAKVVQDAVDRYADRITRVEVFFSDENSSQKSGEIDKRCVIEARLRGLKPITVSCQSESIDQALDGATDKLVTTLQRAIGRRDALFKRSARQLDTLAAMAPRLQQHVEAGAQHDFKTALLPLRQRLEQHARRELRIMEASGTLAPGQVAFDELFDEALSRAWLKYATRPPRLPLDLWLTNIVDEILQERRAQRTRPLPSADENGAETLAHETPQIDDQEWWMWLLGVDDSSAGDDAIPARPGDWTEEFLKAEELTQRIHALLGELPDAQRQALVLNAFEGYELAEIAMLQDRTEEEVRSDIEAARNHLRKRMGGDVIDSRAGQAEALAGRASS